MFRLKTNEEIGIYLKKLILSNYPSCRQFCIDYLEQAGWDYEDPEEIRKMTNRISQILNGKKSIQTYDLPVFSELLGVSCEEMLSAGAIHLPISTRRTNYFIAFSKNKREWIKYLNREDHIAAYADEFGKTVVDYAIELKNYDFLKFLVEKGYITFVSSEGNLEELNFGASTTLKERPYEHHTFEDELCSNLKLRTQLIALALESNDETVLKEMRAREVPTQLWMSPYHCKTVTFKEYYDEQYIDVILRSNDRVFNYFLEEYSLPLKYDRGKITWIFPFLNILIERAIEQRNKRIDILLDIAIKHNEEAFKALKQAVLNAARDIKQWDRKRSYEEILDSVLSSFQLNDEANVFVFYCRSYSGNTIETAATNIIKVDASSNNVDIQKKIDRLNEVYAQIVDIRNYLIKKQ